MDDPKSDGFVMV